jgi:hypothetical protein
MLLPPNGNITTMQQTPNLKSPIFCSNQLLFTIAITKKMRLCHNAMKVEISLVTTKILIVLGLQFVK